MPKEVKHAPGALLPKPAQQSQLQCNNTDTITYGDLKVASKAILTGIIKPEDLKRAQLEDEYCRRHIQTTRQKRSKNFTVRKGILFYKTQIVLPTALLDILINSKHFSIFGLHASITRIKRDINNHYHCQPSQLSNKLRAL